MPFRYPTDVEEKEFEPLAEGEYHFETISAVDKPSKSTGKDMLTLNLAVYDNKGGRWIHTDYIVDTTAYKLKQYWVSVGEPEMFSGKNEVHDFIGRCGILKTKIETSLKDGITYRNSKVAKYLPPKNQEVKKEEDFIDDNIEF